MVDIIEWHTTARFGPPHPRTVRVVLRYRTDDPYAVELCFPGPARLTATLVVEDGGAVEDGPQWTVGRDLLREGRFGEAGIGDLRVRPDGVGGVRLAFRSGGGDEASIRLDERDLTAFLEGSYQLVPMGAESAAVDWPQTAEEFLGRAY